MPVDVTTSTLIAAPRSTVADYACNPDNAPRWYVNTAEAKWVTEPALAAIKVILER